MSNADARAGGNVETTRGNDARVIELLRELRLPAEGLDSAEVVFIVNDGAGLAGCAALERYGQYGLLRSVAVAEKWRGRGYAARLTDAVIGRAQSLGLARLYLLTETADTYFPRFGFATTSRDRVPSEVQGSLEFSSLCPDTAVVMVRSLGATAGP